MIGNLFTGALFFLAVPWARYLGKKLIALYRERGVIKPNYRGQEITPALGPALLLAYLPALGLVAWLDGGRAAQVMAAATVLLGAALYGLWDDLLADPVSGFKGHLAALAQGRFTAGLLKIIMAGLVGFIFAAARPVLFAEKLLTILLIALSANGLNLLDRRPGRALKAFVLGAGLFFLLVGPPRVLWLLGPLLVAALAVAPFDLGGRAMLGDCGANLLGAALGLAMVYYLPPAWQLILVFFWLVLHAYAEISSLSLLIERLPLLKYLDRWGVP